MLDFLLEFSQLNLELHSLLGYRFIPGNVAMETPVGETLSRILRYNNEARIPDRDLEMRKLSMFCRHLQIVRESRPELFRCYRKRLRSQDSSDSFFGARFEVNIAASLIRKGLNFETPDPPDFQLASAECDLSLECTSARIRGTRTAHFGRKVVLVVSQKLKSLVTDPSSTAVLVDITNVFHKAARSDDKPVVPKIVEAVREKLATVDLASVFLFHYIYDGIGMHSGYQRVDNQNIHARVLSSIDKCFPPSNGHVEGFGIPTEG